MYPSTWVTQRSKAGWLGWCPDNIWATISATLVLICRSRTYSASAFSAGVGSLTSPGGIPVSPFDCIQETVPLTAPEAKVTVPPDGMGPVTALLALPQ
jgi:hypothetical protein